MRGHRQTARDSSLRATGVRAPHHGARAGTCRPQADRRRMGLPPERPIIGQGFVHAVLRAGSRLWVSLHSCGCLLLPVGVNRCMWVRISRMTSTKSQVTGSHRGRIAPTCRKRHPHARSIAPTAKAGSGWATGCGQVQLETERAPCGARCGRWCGVQDSNL